MTPRNRRKPITIDRHVKNVENVGTLIKRMCYATTTKCIGMVYRECRCDRVNTKLFRFIINSTFFQFYSARFAQLWIVPVNWLTFYYSSSLISFTTNKKGNVLECGSSYVIKCLNISIFPCEMMTWLRLVKCVKIFCSSIKIISFFSNLFSRLVQSSATSSPVCFCITMTGMQCSISSAECLLFGSSSS